MTDAVQGRAVPVRLRLYRPSNGSEGDGFEGAFCDRCERDREWREHERNPCEVHNAALAFGTDEEGYPTEWRYDPENKPVCTAFKLDATVPEPVPLTVEDIAEIEAEAERIAFVMFATAHPVEAHDEWPDRFWEYFHTQAPNMTREQMVALLDETRAAAEACVP